MVKNCGELCTEFRNIDSDGAKTARGFLKKLLHHIVKRSVDYYSETGEQEHIFTFEDAVQAIKEIQRKGYSPTILFIPIEFYTEMHQWKTPSGKMAIQYPCGSESYFAPYDIATLKIFWSSKYTPLDKVLVFDRSFARWIVKTDSTTNEYIHVEVEDSDEPDKFIITAKTVVKFIMIKSNALRILSPSRIPKME